MGDINPRDNTQPIIDKTTMRVPPHTIIEKHHSHVGPILGILVIILVLILTGLFIWGGMLRNEMDATPEEPIIINNEPETPRAEADQQILETLSPSDEVTSIEADINSTNLDSFDSDMNTMDAEMNAGI